MLLYIITPNTHTNYKNTADTISFKYLLSMRKIMFSYINYNKELCLLKLKNAVRASILIMFAFYDLSFAAMAAAPGQSLSNIWFAPRNQPPMPAPDFMKLFERAAPWGNAASHVKVFKLYPQFLDNASDANLKAVIDGLRQRNIKLAIEYGLLNPNDPDVCGGISSQCWMIEGFGGDTLAKALTRLKSLGGELDYVAMDEPLWFGAVSTQSGAPRASITALAQNVAKQVATVHKIFPNAQVGDIEPVLGAGGPSSWNQQIIQWASAFRRVVGQPLAFLHTDVAWEGTGSREQLDALHGLLHAEGVPFGIIYNGNFGDGAVEWTQFAEQRFSSIESNPNSVPDHAVLQSWNPEPLYALPETQPGTMTYLVNRYTTAETIITAAPTKSGYAGTLTSKGIPVGGAKVSVYKLDDGKQNIMTTPTLKNIVPPDAALAVVALRINTECNCNGPADVLLGPARYVNETSHTTIVKTMRETSQRLVVSPGQTLLVNSTPIQVTPGDAFSFSVPMQMPYTSANTGYVAIAFLRKSGTEIMRLELPFQPGHQLIGTATTDMIGRFAIATEPASFATFTFSGNANLRLSSASSPGNVPKALH